MPMAPGMTSDSSHRGSFCFDTRSHAEKLAFEAGYGMLRIARIMAFV